MAASYGSNDELWRACANWLTSLDVIRSDHRANGPTASIADLANILRDGVLLCSLLNKLDPGCIDLKDVNQKPQLAQFLCLRNIQIFLRTCRDIFCVKESDLFEPLMLFDLTNFHKVLCTLAKLSTCPKAQKSSVQGFTAQKTRTSSQEEIYQGLQAITESEPRGSTSSGSEPSWLQFTIKCRPEDREKEVYEDLCYVTFSPCPNEFVGQPTLEKRDYVIKELVDTETNYVEVLEKLKRNFMRPLENLLTPEDHATIFCEITNLSEIHSGFLSQLHEACGSLNGTTKLSDVFLRWRERFLIYGKYCSNLPLAQHTLQEWCDKSDPINKKVARCQQEDNHGKFKLRDVLSVPMQRILKYHLLLQKLIELTEPNHEEYQDLKRAREAMVDVANYINEVARDSEHLNILQDLQGRIVTGSDNFTLDVKLKQYGRLIKDGELKIKKHEDHKLKNRYVFIFDMVMILCKQVKGDSFQCKNVLDLREYRVEDAHNRPVLNREARWSYQWVLVQITRETHNQTVYTLYARTVELKNAMIKAIETAKDNIEPSSCKNTTHKFDMHSFDQSVSCNRCSKFLKGLIFQGYKCKVCNIAVHKECIAQSGRCGLPPIPAPHLPPNPATRLEDKLWFANTMDRISATHMLENRLEGTYLVRIRPQSSASSSERFALSLKTNDTVKHMKVCSTVQNNVEKFFLSQSRYFHSIIDLVNNYQTMSLRENFEKLGENVRLKYPFKQILCNVLRDFFPRESTQLTLREGSQVLVIEKDCDMDGWWKGKINGQIGYFPINYVKPFKEVTYDLEFEMSASQEN